MSFLVTPMIHTDRPCHLSPTVWFISSYIAADTNLSILYPPQPILVVFWEFWWNSGYSRFSYNLTFLIHSNFTRFRCKSWNFKNSGAYKKTTKSIFSHSQTKVGLM